MKNIHVKNVFKNFPPQWNVKCIRKHVIYLYNNKMTFKINNTDSFQKGVIISGGTTDTIELEDGTEAEPSLSFINDTDTGIYRSGNNTLNVSTNGTSKLQVGENDTISSNNIVVQGTLDVTSTTNTTGLINTGDISSTGTLQIGSGMASPYFNFMQTYDAKLKTTVTVNTPQQTDPDVVNFTLKHSEYFRFGNLVYVTFIGAWNQRLNSSGFPQWVYFTLPFSISTNCDRVCGSMGVVNNVFTNSRQVVLFGNAGDYWVRLRYLNSSSGSTDIRASNFGSTGEIQWNIWFCTTDQ